MKRLLALFLVGLLVFSLAACGNNDEANGPDDNTPNNGTQDPVDEDNGDLELNGEFYIFDQYEIFNTFQAVEYSLVADTVDGMDIVKLAYTFIKREHDANLFEMVVTQDNETDYAEIWINDDAEVVRLRLDGSEVPAEATEAAAAPFSIFFGFLTMATPYAEAFQTEHFETHGWTLENKWQDKRDFGAGAVPVLRYNLMMEDGQITEWEVAAIGEHKLFTKWKLIVETSKGAAIIEMDVQKLILH